MGKMIYFKRMQFLKKEWKKQEWQDVDKADELDYFLDFCVC